MSFTSRSEWKVILNGPAAPLTLTRGRNQLLGNSVPGSGSVTHGPAPEGDEQVLVGAPLSTTGVLGKSVQRPLGPVQRMTMTPLPPWPPAGLPPVPSPADLTPAQPEAIA